MGADALIRVGLFFRVSFPFRTNFEGGSELRQRADVIGDGER